MKSGLKGIKHSSSETLRGYAAIMSNYEGMNQGSDSKDGEEGKHLRATCKLTSIGLGNWLHLVWEREGGVTEAFGLGLSNAISNIRNMEEKVCFDEDNEARFRYI